MSIQDTQADADYIIDQLDNFMAAMDEAATNSTWPPVTSCPFHWPLLQLGFDGRIQTEEQAQALNQYLTEAAAVQPSIFLGGNGQLSTYKACSCWMAVDQGNA